MLGCVYTCVHACVCVRVWVCVRIRFRIQCFCFWKVGEWRKRWGFFPLYSFNATQVSPSSWILPGRVKRMLLIYAKWSTLGWVVLQRSTLLFLNFILNALAFFVFWKIFFNFPWSSPCESECFGLFSSNLKMKSVKSQMYFRAPLCLNDSYIK